MTSSFEQFCGDSPFWNETLLLEGTYPQFTECFRHVALTWIPCLLYLFVSLFYIAYLFGREPCPPLPVSCLNSLKMVFSFALLAVTLVVIIDKGRSSQQKDITDALYVSEGLKAACFFTSLLMTQIERKKNAVISPLQWSYWLLMVISSVVNFYTYIIEQVQHSDFLLFICFYVYYGLLILQLLTFSFVEKRKEGYQDLSKTVNPSPEITASVPSRLTFLWLTRLIVKGFRKTLSEDDVYDLVPSDITDANVPFFEKMYTTERERAEAYNKKIRPKVSSSTYKTFATNNFSNEKTPLIRGQEKSIKEQRFSNDLNNQNLEKDSKMTKPLKEPSLLKVLFITVGPRLLTAQIIKTLMDLLTFATPKITEALLNYVSRRDVEQKWKGYTLACSYFVVQLIVSLGSNQALLLSKRMGMRIKAVLISAIYKKSLTISSTDDTTTAGEIVNLMSVDCQRMEDVCTNLYLMFSMPFQLALALYLLYDQLNVAVFAGLGVMLLAVPVNAFIGVFLKKYQIQQMMLKDQRMRIMSEVLSGMKVLKLYAWEGSFQQKIEAIRKLELEVIKKFAYIIGAMIFMFNCMPYLV